jgi:hypothetical protein
VPPFTDGAEDEYDCATTPLGSESLEISSAGLGRPKRTGPAPASCTRDATTPPKRTPARLVMSSVASGTYTTPPSSITFSLGSITTGVFPADQRRTPAYGPSLGAVTKIEALGANSTPPSTTYHVTASPTTTASLPMKRPVQNTWTPGPKDTLPVISTGWG